MEEITFSSIKELYNRLLPALKSKKKLINNEGFKNIKEKDIWEFMYVTRWQNETGLTLADMVSDILHEDNKVIINYCQRKILENISKNN